MYREPSLSAQPAPLVLIGNSVTLQCHSEPGFHRFALTKDEGTISSQRLDGQQSPDFPLGPVTFNHGGRYTCYSGHNLSYVWSAPSAPLDILITGEEPCPAPCPDCLLGAVTWGHGVQVVVLEQWVRGAEGVTRVKIKGTQ